MPGGGRGDDRSRTDRSSADRNRSDSFTPQPLGVRIAPDHLSPLPLRRFSAKLGISQATYFNWKKKYAGLMPSGMKRLRELEDENKRLKKIVADLMLGREMLQDVVKRKL